MNELIQRWWIGRDLPIGIHLSETEIVATYSSPLRAVKSRQSISGPMPKGGFEAGTILKADEVGIAIRDMISKANCAFDRCGIALEPPAYFMKKIVPPTNLIGTVGATLTAWALEHFGFDPEDVNGHVIWSEGKSTGVFVGVKRQVLDSYQTAVRWARLDLDVVTLRPIALHWLAQRRLKIPLSGACVLIDARSECGYIYQFDTDGTYDGVRPFRGSSELSEELHRALAQGEKDCGTPEPAHPLHPEIVIFIDADSQILADDVSTIVSSFGMRCARPHSTIVVRRLTNGCNLVTEALASFLGDVDGN